MLDTLRKSVTGPFVKILIGILILSFAVWGIQDIFGNFKKTVAIEMMMIMKLASINLLQNIIINYQ